MNRSFNAFGVLLSLLAVTMIAVSSTSRSTTVMPANQRTNRVSNRLKAALPTVQVATDAASNAAHDEGLCVPGSGEETTAVAAESVVTPVTAVDVVEVAKLTTRLAPVRIAEAEGSVCNEERGPVDCRSYYDAVYDWAVLGWSQPITPIAVENEVGASLPLTDVEVTSLFKSVIDTAETASREKTPKRALHRVGPGNSTTGTVLPALQKWVLQYVERLAEPVQQNETPEWSEYAELIDSAILRQNISADVARSFGGE